LNEFAFAPVTWSALDAGCVPLICICFDRGYCERRRGWYLNGSVRVKVNILAQNH